MVLLLMIATMVPLSLRAEKRTFIDQTGRSLEGELVTASGDTVTIKRSSDGQTFTTKAANFSKADQAYFIGKGGTATMSPSAASTVGSTSASIAPMRIEVKVYPNKSQKGRNGGIDDEKIERISYRVDIRNGEQKRAFNGGKAVVMAFADNLQDRSESSVILRDEFDVSLEPLGSLSHDTKEARLQFDNQGYKYGFKYSGYIVVVKDAKGKSVTVAASSGTVAKFADDILKLSLNDTIDKNYKFVKKGPPRG
jgi:hypothetical protein